jgi:hypothetical protein
MYSTFAVQSNENAWQQYFAFVLPYVLLWSNRVVIHLANDDSRDDPPPLGVARKDPRTLAYFLLEDYTLDRVRIDIDKSGHSSA